MIDNLLGSGDPEYTHVKADDLLLSALQDLGFAELTEAWKRAEEDVRGFWYA